MNLYSSIFNKVYKFTLNELDDAKSGIIRDSVINLRESYRSNAPITDYKDENIRNAYMLCYYMHYINPAYIITRDELLKYLVNQNKKKYIISYFGAGPAPEVYGSLKALSEAEFNTRLEINILDLQEDWLGERKITTQLINELEGIKLSPINNISGCDLKLDCKRNCTSYKKCKDSVLDSDVIFMQNIINHLGSDKYFIEGVKNKIACLKDNSFFVIIDLDYEVVKDTINQINDYSSTFAKIIATNINKGASEYVSEEIPPPEISKFIFTGKPGLILKRKTRYYYTVIQISKEASND